MENENNEEIKNPEAVLAELRRAQADLKELRSTLKSLETERDTLKSQVETLSADEMRLRALTAETKLALSAQGIGDVDRLIKYVGTDGLDFGEDGKITGLDERLTSLREDLPEVFDAKRRVGGKADIFADTNVETKKSGTELQVDRLFNKNGG